MPNVICWNCEKETDIKDNDYGEHNCNLCGVPIDVFNPALIEPYEPNGSEGEEEMGKLADRAKEKSPFIKLEIGEETPALVYKSWKETTDNFGNETFRYLFDLHTDNGIVTKQLDNRSQSFAEAMDKIAFGEKVILKREPKLDHEGEPVENKSIWTVKKVE